MIRNGLCFVFWTVTLVACRDHTQPIQPQAVDCQVAQINIAYEDHSGYKSWRSQQYDEQERITAMTDSAATWLARSFFAYSGSTVRRSQLIPAISGNPTLTTYTLTNQGYVVWPGYHYDQQGYLLEIDTPQQFHQLNTFVSGNLVKRVISDGIYQVVYTYTYDMTKDGVPYALDELALFNGKQSRNLLLNVTAVSGPGSGTYAQRYTYADYKYEYDAQGRVVRSERHHFLYGYSVSTYTYGCSWKDS